MEGITLRKRNLFSLKVSSYVVVFSECMNPFDRKWYNFNDSHVREVGDSIIKRYATTGGSSPYLLFYCKRSLLK